MKNLLLVVILFMLAGCATKPVIVAQTNICSGWKVIKVDGNDQLTDSTAKQILAHNCQGAALKCWAYPRNDPSVCEAK